MELVCTMLRIGDYRGLGWHYRQTVRNIERQTSFSTFL